MAAKASFRSVLIALILAAAAQASSAKAQGLAAPPIVAIRSVNFSEGKFSATRDTTRRAPVRVVVNWSLQIPAQPSAQIRPQPTQTTSRSSPQDQLQGAASTQRQGATQAAPDSASAQQQRSAAAAPTQSSPAPTQTTILSSLVELEANLSDGSKQTHTHTLNGSECSVGSQCSVPLLVGRTASKDFVTFKLMIRTTFRSPGSTTPSSVVVDTAGTVPPLGQAAKKDDAIVQRRP